MGDISLKGKSNILRGKKEILRGKTLDLKKQLLAPVKEAKKAMKRLGKK